MSQVIDVAEPILERWSSQVARHDFVALLADPDGVVVHRSGGGEFGQVAEKVRLIEGAHWSEQARGTNAIGTALAEGVPVNVLGQAHFARNNHGLVCYASPVRGPDGQTVAILDITSHISRQADFAPLTVQSAAYAIEEALRLRTWPSWGGHSLQVLAQAVERCATPALIIERPGRVRLANPAARLALSNNRASFQGGGLEGLLGVGWGQLERALLDNRLEATVGAAHDGIFAHHKVHAEPVTDAHGRLWAVVLFMEPPSSARRTPLATPSPLPDGFEALVGTDPVFGASLNKAARLARARLPLLLLAETGTGKGMLARAIHRASRRADGPLVTLNCGAFAPDLVASELFGYAPGAFTGAHRAGRAGQLAAANGGTLFLDEIAELPPSAQVMLLRFLEDGQYRRVGEDKARRADVRLICATCRDLGQMVSEGTFRQDLYFRIKGASLSLPPLRERVDLEVLCEALLEQLAAEEEMEPAAQLSPAAMVVLESHAWPGNVRELKMVLHQALVMSFGEAFIEPHHLGLEVAPRLPLPEPAAESVSASTMVERQVTALRQALARAGGNVSQAARSLGVARSTIYRMMKRHDIS